MGYRGYSEANGFIVDPTGITGDFKTIQAAVNAAIANNATTFNLFTIFLKEGNYFENVVVNVTFPLNICSWPTNSGEAGFSAIQLNGSIDVTTTSTFGISGLYIQGSGTACIVNSSSSFIAEVNISNCNLGASSAPAIVTSGGNTIVRNCRGQISNPSYVIFYNNGGNLFIYDSDFTNGAHSPNQNRVSGETYIFRSTFENPIQTTGGNFHLDHVKIDSSFNNQTSCQETSICDARYCEFYSGTAPAVSLSAGILYLEHCILDSTAMYAISGSGVVEMGSVVCQEGSTIDPGIAVVPLVTLPYLTGQPVLTVDGDTGSSVPTVAGVFQVIADTASLECGQSVKFTASANQVLLNVTDTNSNTIIGNGSGVTGSPPFGGYTGLGTGNFTGATGGGDNIAVGQNNFIVVSSGGGISLGNSNFPVDTTGAQNIAIGNNHFGSLVSGSANVLLSTSSGFPGLISGSANVGIGISGNVGNAYTGSESQNLLICSSGLVGENAAIHIGDNGSYSTFYVGGVNTSSNNASAPVVVVNLSTGQLTQAAGIITAPPSSNTSTTGYGSLVVGTARQNSLGYDILVNVSISVTAAAAATISLGVGSTSTPTTDPVIASLSVSTLVSFSAIVPSGYYMLVTTTGTITVGSITTQVCPI